MNKTVSIIAGTVILAAFALTATAQEAPTGPQPHKGSAETSLLGISLYDPGTRVIAKYGSPDQIQGLSTGGGTTAGPSNTGGSRGGGPGVPAGGGSRPSGGGGGNSGSSAAPGAGPDFDLPLGSIRGVIGDPFAEGDSQWWRQRRPVAAGGGGDAGGDDGGRGAGRPGGPPEVPGAPGGGGGGGGATGGTGTKVIFTRWIYKRKNSKYSFVLDKFNRVVQIEAIGLKNSSVRTKRGMTFGSSFGSIVQKYNAPDGYEINGDNVVVRYLVRDHVAFRLSRLDPKKPIVVTGVVVAAGKT